MDSKPRLITYFTNPTVIIIITGLNNDNLNKMERINGNWDWVKGGLKTKVASKLLYSLVLHYMYICVDSICG